MEQEQDNKDLPEPEFWDSEDETLDLVCPNCGADYDEIDYEYQICHLCRFRNNNHQNK